MQEMKRLRNEIYNIRGKHGVVVDDRFQGSWVENRTANVDTPVEKKGSLQLDFYDFVLVPSFMTLDPEDEHERTE